MIEKIENISEKSEKEVLRILLREMIPNIPLSNQEDVIRQFEEFSSFCIEKFGVLITQTLCELFMKNFESQFLKIEKFQVRNLF